MTEGSSTAREGAGARRWVRAMANPLGLVVGGAGVAAGLAISSAPLVAVGLAVYLLLAAWRLARPSPRREALDAERAASRLDPFTLRDPLLRDAIALVKRALDELLRVLEESHVEVLQAGELQRTVEDLTGRAGRLAHTGEDIWSHISREDPAVVRKEAERLEGKARTAADPATGKQWADAAQTRREHLQLLLDLHAAHERILANLARIAGSLDGLSAKVVRMGALDAQAQASLTGDMNDELGRINAEVDAFEETLRPLVSAG